MKGKRKKERKICSVIFVRNTNSDLKLMFSDVRGKAVPFHCTMACEGRRGIKLHSLPTWPVDGGQWSNFTTRPIYPREEPRYPLTTWLGRSSSQSAGSGEERNRLPLPGLEPRTIQPAVELRQWSHNSHKVWPLSVDHLIVTAHFFVGSYTTSLCGSMRVASHWITRYQVAITSLLTFWRRNFFSNFSTPCI